VLCQLVVPVVMDFSREVTGARRLEMEDTSAQGAMVISTIIHVPPIKLLLFHDHGRCTVVGNRLVVVQTNNLLLVTFLLLLFYDVCRYYIQEVQDKFSHSSSSSSSSSWLTGKEHTKTICTRSGSTFTSQYNSYM
jgi:hypothetical protein